VQYKISSLIFIAERSLPSLFEKSTASLLIGNIFAISSVK